MAQKRNEIRDQVEKFLLERKGYSRDDLEMAPVLEVTVGVKRVEVIRMTRLLASDVSRCPLVCET